MPGTLPVGFAVILWITLPSALAQAADHPAWDALLRAHVDEAGLVNYQGLKARQSELDAYLESLAQADPASLSREEQLAFWINAYNACVVKGVISRYPLRSVKQAMGFFDGVRYRVAGRDRTLNEIEQEGRALGDWRIHFTLVCASTSCPPLRPEAYVPERVEAQMGEQARRFLSDPARGLRVEGRVLWVSKIFSWYAQDFLKGRHLGTGGRVAAEDLVPVIALYLEPDTLQAIGTLPMRLKFLEYDWTLNERR